MKALEKQLDKAGGIFITGSRMTMADFVLFSQMQDLKLLRLHKVALCGKVGSLVECLGKGDADYLCDCISNVALYTQDLERGLTKRCHNTQSLLANILDLGEPLAVNNRNL